MLGEVVGVPVGDEGEFAPVMRIQKEVELRPLQGGSSADFDEGFRFHNRVGEGTLDELWRSANGRQNRGRLSPFKQLREIDRLLLRMAYYL